MLLQKLADRAPCGAPDYWAACSLTSFGVLRKEPPLLVFGVHTLASDCDSGGMLTHFVRSATQGAASA